MSNLATFFDCTLETMISNPIAKQWCEQAAKGDQVAATNLLREFYKPIFAYHRRLSRNNEDAADLTQITFSKVWNSISLFRAASSVSTWIYRIAYCSYVDWVRQARPSSQQTDEWWQELPAAERSPFDLSADLELNRRLFVAVETLSDANRDAIHLHYYQGLSLAETAEVLDVPKSTLKYRLRNALDQLRQQFLQHPSIQNSNKTNSI